MVTDVAPEMASDEVTMLLMMLTGCWLFHPSSVSVEVEEKEEVPEATFLISYTVRCPGEAEAREGSSTDVEKANAAIQDLLGQDCVLHKISFEQVH